MLAEEVLFAVILNLDRAFKLAPEGKPITWSSSRSPDIPQGEMQSVIEKFVCDYKAIEFVVPWTFYRSFNGSTSYHWCKIRKTSNFDEVYVEISKAYKRLQGIKDGLSKSLDVLKLDYTSDRKLLVNGIFLLAEPRYGSINDKLLRFLTEHPNTVYSRKELEDENVLEEKEDKSFYTFLDDINVKGDLKKVFFSEGLSKDSICLTNPVDDKKLKENRISYVDLRSLFGNKN